ncbi:Enzymatic polyprotein [Abeliophyllum distichum]|uniref:Enzymatic polyprotein n=1 Tax=Abeliophyllum distichum TaxID=126358 RepID=A0ABD1RY77_9LAMI
MSPKALRSSPKNETLLIEINPLHSNVAIPKRLSWDQVTQNPLWTFENELPPVREAPNSRLKKITELADGSVQVQFASSSSTSRYSFQSSRSEPFQTFKQSEKQPSDKFKGVDFTPNIPKTHYSEEEDDSTHRGSESPTLSDIRSQRDQLNVISSTIDRKREFKKDKDPQKILVSSNGLTSKSLNKNPRLILSKINPKSGKQLPENTFQSVHPPLEEIVIPKGDVKVIASPLKQISDKGEHDNPTIKDIKNIQQQNNYTNILLHSVATQLNQIEQPVQNELIKQDKIKGKEKAKEEASKTLFKPNRDKVHFGSGTSDVLLQIVQQLRDKESTSKINVIDSIEELQEQFEELKINKLKDKSFERHPLPHFYPRPTFPDILLEEPRPPQKTFSGLEVIVWNIDGMTEHQIMQVIAEMSMASSAYSAKDEIHNAVKKEGDSPLDPSKQDAVCTLLFTIIKHFIGEPSSFMEKSSELLMNLTCPKLQDFRWYKDIFLQKVMTRADCKFAFWKERFIAGLPKLFAERVRNSIKDKHSNLPYDDLTFGQIIGFINKEGLSLCNDLKLKAKLKTDRMEGRKELGSFCEQYGYEPSEKELIQDIISQIQDPDLKQKFQQILDPVQEPKPPPRTYNVNDVFDRFKKSNKSSSSQDLCHEVNQMKKQISDLDKELSQLKFEVSIIKTYSPSPSKGKEKIQSHSNSETSDSSNDENAASLDSPIKIQSPSNEKQSMNIISQIRLQKWYTIATIIINKEYRIKTRVLLDSGADQNYIREGIVPTKYFEKTTGNLYGASGKSLNIQYKLTQAHVCNGDICFKSSFYLVKDLDQEVILGTPFLVQLYPITVTEKGLSSNTSTMISSLNSQILPHIETFTRVLEQLESKQFKSRISEIDRAIRKEVCSTIPNAFWNRKKHIVTLPYIPDFNENQIPTKARPIQMNKELLDTCTKEIQDLLGKRLIRPSKSLWSCAAFYVNNHGEIERGAPRLVINYKPLNQVLQWIRYPMPQKKDLLNRLLNAVIFSKFDLKSGFWQIQIDEKDRYKTAFNVPFGQYEWNVMPFGLKNAPSEFQKIMNDIFNPYKNFSIVYIDDVLIYSDSIEQHLKHLQIFLSVAKKNGLAVSEKKIVLCQTKIKFLGHEIFRGTITPIKRSLEFASKFPDQILDKTSLQRFLGCVNYISDFIPNIRQICEPLYQRLRKTPLAWSDKHTEAC